MPKSYSKIKLIVKEFNERKNVKPKIDYIVRELALKYCISKATVYSYLKRYNR